MEKRRLPDNFLMKAPIIEKINFKMVKGSKSSGLSTSLKSIEKTFLVLIFYGISHPSNGMNNFSIIFLVNFAS